MRRIIFNIVGAMLIILSFIILMDRYYPVIPIIIPNTSPAALSVLAINLDQSDPNIYSQIHERYPISAGGREIIYSSLYRRNLETADKILNDVYVIQRFENVEIKNITWEEDPYNDVYWRFLFYGFDPATHLLYAGENAKRKDRGKYYNKLLLFTDSFINQGIYKPNSWKDSHAVAFRAMILTDTWWKLRQENKLTEDESVKILKAIKVHGDFLAQDSHYDIGNQNGINEANSLLLLSVNFPDMPGAQQWGEIAKKRINESLNNLVNDDGVLIGNSPYYHFYALEKYWDLYSYTKNYGINIGDQFENKILQMISYGTYILQPDLEVPLLDASIKRKINYAGLYSKLAKTDPALLYVMTQGKEGTQPPKLNVQFENTGQTILRSGWGKGNEFKDQTQLVFDNGNYRTSQSHLDALSFSLYGDGMVLMPDSGLYSYEENEVADYFKSTYAHNTIVVDGKNQEIDGHVVAGELVEGDGYAYQAAVSNLYFDAVHKRAIMLIGKDAVLIIDELNSDTPHEYEQIFHLAPRAQINADNLNIDATWNDKKQMLRIVQLLSQNINLQSAKGSTSPPKGICSSNYNSITPCEMLSYSQKGNNAKFITLIEIGKHNEGYITANVSKDGKTINVIVNKKEYNIQINETLKIDGQIETQNNSLQPIPRTGIDLINELGQKESGEILIQSNSEGMPVDKIYNTKLDLTDKNIFLNFRVLNIPDTSSLSIALSTNNWQGYTSYSFLNSYRKEDDENFVSLSIGKGKERDTGGNWKEGGTGFDWSNIDEIRFRITSRNGTESTLDIKEFSTTPGQKEGVVIIIFDDAAKSIKPAIDVMNEYGFKGNIAAIGRYILGLKKGYLSLNELKEVQDNHGWNIISHSYSHNDALVTYHSPEALKQYEEDIKRNLIYLVENNINSAPNWYVYPHGTTNEEVEQIIGKYYKFARITQNSPEAFPFGDPLRVKTMSVDLNVPAEHVYKAISDAKKYNLALFLTFHKICNGADCDMNTEYDIEDFRNIMDEIKRQDIKVKSLSEFDNDNGVTRNEIFIKKEIPVQIILDVNMTDHRNPVMKFLQDFRI